MNYKVVLRQYKEYLRETEFIIKADTEEHAKQRVKNLVDIEHPKWREVGSNTQPYWIESVNEITEKVDGLSY
jgi:hypothetical protein